jgi:16S rRNA U1498 N3-methylase RsmE
MQQKLIEPSDYKFSAAKTSLEEKRVTLENRLSRNLQKKHALELRINGEFEKIKAVETAIEKINDMGIQKITKKQKV